jgi:hypothetical protein
VGAVHQQLIGTVLWGEALGILPLVQLLPLLVAAIYQRPEMEATPQQHLVQP